MRFRSCVFRLIALCAVSLSPVDGVAQFTQQGPKLVANDTSAPSVEGVAVALSSDGNTAIVGGLEDDNFIGAAWVWTRTGGTWTQQGSKLIGSGAIGLAQQGTAVAVSADGNTAIVGGPRDLSADLTRQLGAAWVFTRSGGTWTQQGPKLVGSGAVGSALQGSSVALSADGNTAVMGGIGDNGIGAVWVFTRSGGTWTQQGPKLVGTGFVSALCGGVDEGFSVALSADGNTAIVGADADNSCQGAAWIFVRSGTTWSQQGPKLVGTGGTTFAQQGTSVALSADGNTALIGGPRDSSDTGAAWVFTRSGTTWTQQGSRLIGTGAATAAGQGGSVGLSADGNTAIVGGPHDAGDIGAVWVFTRSGGTWTQLGGKLVGTGVVLTAQQATAAAISADGSTILSGGFSDDHFVGATWVFAITADLSTSLTPSSATVNAGQNFSYTIGVANGGSSIAPSVTLTDTLPPGVSFVSASGNGWTCGQGAGVVTCTSSLVAVGSANPITINVIAPATAGTLTDTASVSPVATDPSSANNTATAAVTVVASADLSLTKTASAASVTASAPVTYTLSVVNNGPSAASNVTIVDTLPAGATFISASGTGWSCAPGAGTVTCTIGALANGTAAPVSIQIQAPSSGASFVNTASVTSATSDPNSSNNSSASTVALASASIPMLDFRTLLLLAVALAAVALARISRSG